MFYQIVSAMLFINLDAELARAYGHFVLVIDVQT